MKLYIKHIKYLRFFSLGFLNRMAAMSLTFQSFGQGNLQITFDGPPPIMRGTSQSVQEYDEADMSFNPIPANGEFGRNGGGVTLNNGILFPDNGTAYLQGGFLTFANVNASPFDLVAVDIAGYSTALSDFDVQFVGHKANGNTVIANFSGTGIDFSTLSFGPDFRGVIRVDILSSSWSLDNLVISVPEPGVWALLLLGGGLAGWRIFTRKRK